LKKEILKILEEGLEELSLRRRITSKHPNLAKNVRPLDIYGGGGMADSCVPPQRKEDINEEDSLMVQI
jgi:hypothetical protein